MKDLLKAAIISFFLYLIYVKYINTEQIVWVKFTNFERFSVWQFCKFCKGELLQNNRFSVWINLFKLEKKIIIEILWKNCMYKIMIESFFMRHQCIYIFNYTFLSASSFLYIFMITYLIVYYDVNNNNNNNFFDRYRPKLMA